MAFTFTKIRSDDDTLYGGEDARAKRYEGVGNLGNPYTVGGETPTPAQVDSTLPADASILAIEIEGGSVDGAISLSPDGPKIRAFTAPGVEAGAVDLSATPAKDFRVTIVMDTKR